MSVKHSLLLSVCFLGSLSPRVTAITDGADGDVRTFEYFGYLTSNQDNGEPQCGATLISRDHIITVASCTSNWQERALYVQFGVHDWCRHEGPRDSLTWAAIADVFIEDYRYMARSALAVASLKISINSIRPILAPKAQYPSPNAEYGLPGFGVTDVATNKRSCSLQVAQLVPTSPRDICPNGSGLFCAEPNADPQHIGSMCFGDEGGPLVERKCSGSNNCEYYLRGVAASLSGNICGNMNLIRDAYSALQWINRIVNRSSSSSFPRRG